MRSLALALLVPSSILGWTAWAALTFSATAVHRGREVDTASLEFLPIPLRSHHRRNSTSTPRRDRGSSLGKREVVSYSDNWCGISQQSTTSNPITGVSGLFSTPSLSIRPSQPVPQFAAAWVGIDGSTCQQALLQAGTQTVVRFQPFSFSVLLRVSTGQLIIDHMAYVARSDQFQWRAECFRLVAVGAECFVLDTRISRFVTPTPVSLARAGTRVGSSTIGLIQPPPQ